MTKEEAIQVLRDWDGYFIGHGTSDVNEALNMAIEELKKEPKEITIDDVQRYCKPRCLTIITNELLYDLTHITCRHCGTFLLEKNGQMICPACLWIKPTEKEGKNDK